MAVGLRAALIVLVLASSTIVGAQPMPSDGDDPSPQPPRPRVATPGDPAPSAPAVDPMLSGSNPSALLRAANAAATAGDWARVSAYTAALLSRPLDRADLGEAHRLAGLAAFFEDDKTAAESHFVEYLKIDGDGDLDPALYPPEVRDLFAEVRAKHAAELHALRPKARRYWILNLVPPFGQFQNGQRTKGWIVAGLVGGFLTTNVTSYLVLRSWCMPARGDAGPSLVCDQHHNAGAVQSLEIGSGIGLIITYVWAVYDSVSNSRRLTRQGSLAPYATAANNGGLIGVVGRF